LNHYVAGALDLQVGGEHCLYEAMLPLNVVYLIRPNIQIYSEDFVFSALPPTGNHRCAAAARLFLVRPEKAVDFPSFFP
jgi:hypothetical protein